MLNRQDAKIAKVIYYKEFNHPTRHQAMAINGMELIREFFIGCICFVPIAASLLVVGGGSLQVLVKLADVSYNEFEAFTHSLRFPFSIYRHYPFLSPVQFEGASLVGGTIGRLTGTFFSLIFVLFLAHRLVASIANGNWSVVIPNAFWTTVYLFGLFTAWKFGRSLRRR